MWICALTHHLSQHRWYSWQPSHVPLPEPPPPSFSAFRQTVSQPVIASFIAGGIAGAVSRTVVSPLERLKILFQIQSAGRTEYKMSVRKALAKMWHEEGFRGFLAGNGTNCIRIVPYSAVQFGSYNFYKKVGSTCSIATSEKDNLFSNTAIQN